MISNRSTFVTSSSSDFLYIRNFNKTAIPIFSKASNNKYVPIIVYLLTKSLINNPIIFQVRQKPSYKGGLSSYVDFVVDPSKKECPMCTNEIEDFRISVRNKHSKLSLPLPPPTIPGIFHVKFVYIFISFSA
uniref:Uncharacterized protein n=1 Tax=Cacopsylla melanoneura TaxID=428564 RepID=A0A8D8ZC71_9HEMI